MDCMDRVANNRPTMADILAELTQLEGACTNNALLPLQLVWLLASELCTLHMPAMHGRHFRPHYLTALTHSRCVFQMHAQAGAAGAAWQAGD